MDPDSKKRLKYLVTTKKENVMTTYTWLLGAHEWLRVRIGERGYLLSEQAKIFWINHYAKHRILMK